MLIADSWKDYKLIDCANSEKIEKWCDIVLCRPDPQVIWQEMSDEKIWQNVDAQYHRSASGVGQWKYYKKLPEAWHIKYKDLTFNVKPMGFKHTGIFPEQAVNWDFIMDKIKNAKRDIKVLNLFAYTGGATIAAAKAGASVVHVDAAKGMDYTYHVEELWLDPFNFLMLAQNIKSGFNEYVDDPYLMGEIEKNYDKLNIQVSALDVEFKEAIENASNKSIVVSDDVFKFLEKYGFNVISLEENENLNAKIVSDAKNLIKNGTIQYIFIKDNEEVNSTIQSILDSTDVETVSLHSLSILSEEDRKNELDYISIMKANIEKIRKELYK